ncbi:MAG TPA: social motility TPR repeat lipoprotein Tgl [Aggregicoccus sp.]|nr:social motility TPR repeat lipoprotein Tgl [Aggregicoccus sp.]
MPRSSSSRFVVLALALAAALPACKHTPTEREKQGSESRYDLGVLAQQQGRLQEAYTEFERAVELDPDNADAHHALGILLHLAFNRPEEAIKHYQRALEVRPTFSEAKSNLGNVYLSTSRYDEAIRLYKEALNDMLYPTPYIAQNNLGWALYKKGDKAQALQNIKAAVTTNPQFCLGFKNLGLIAEEGGDHAEACRQYARYRQACPETADALKREGVCQARSGQAAAAKASFASCEAKAQAQDLKDECRQLAEQL